jgi:hypothetical protein
MAGGFVRHLVRGQLAEFVVNLRQEFGGGFGIAVLDAIEESRDITHEWIINDQAKMSILERNANNENGPGAITDTHRPSPEISHPD